MRLIVAQPWLFLAIGCIAMIDSKTLEKSAVSYALPLRTFVNGFVGIAYLGLHLTSGLLGVASWVKT
jgi:hypothetical protein